MNPEELLAFEAQFQAQIDRAHEAHQRNEFTDEQLQQRLSTIAATRVAELASRKKQAATAALIVQRDAVGAAYAAAAAAYVAAYAELHAHDIVLGPVVGGCFPMFEQPTPHGMYLRSPIHGGVQDRVMARVHQLNKNLEA